LLWTMAQLPLTSLDVPAVVPAEAAVAA